MTISRSRFAGLPPIASVVLGAILACPMLTAAETPTDG
jgi:hypothetical protein